MVSTECSNDRLQFALAHGGAHSGHALFDKQPRLSTNVVTLVGGEGEDVKAAGRGGTALHKLQKLLCKEEQVQQVDEEQ